MQTIDVINALGPRLSTLGTLVVAGGAVRDELLGRTPKDFDLFILRGNGFNEDYRAQVMPLIEGLPTVKYKLEWHKSEPFLVETVTIDGCEIQIMASPASTQAELLAGFDWNVCLFSRSRAALFNQEEVGNIKEGNYLRLNKITFPYSTLRRGYRFSERYKMRLKTEDIDALCKACLKGKN